MVGNPLDPVDFRPAPSDNREPPGTVPGPRTLTRRNVRHVILLFRLSVVYPPLFNQL